MPRYRVKLETTRVYRHEFVLEADSEQGAKDAGHRACVSHQGDLHVTRNRITDVAELPPQEPPA
jgi:hypothetical protein